MRWVDHQDYFGPDRRRKLGSLRIRERRRYDCSGKPPPLPTALRQLRMRVLDASGPGRAAFAGRAQGVAILAQLSGEAGAAAALSRLAARAARGRDEDVRPALYLELDAAHAALASA